MHAYVMSKAVTMMCMTTKQKFDVDEPPVVVLKNGRYAYKAECPWKGKNDKTLYAFKFCGHEAHEAYSKRGQENASVSAA
jgi:hypothetical protein